MTLTEAYQSKIADGALTPDPVQQSVLRHFDRVLNDLAAPRPKGGLFRKAAPVEIKGLYLWGGVGRGKSMLMDLAHELVPVTKERWHFHAFMQAVHREMGDARKRGVDDAIKPVAEAIAARIEFLAFDEMQISDITDAMIVGRLFEALFAAGVTIVTTSNRPPDDLYKDGLNRQLFVPFIKLIKDRLEVVELASDTDHRQGRLTGSDTYFTPDNRESRATMRQLWEDLIDGPAEPLMLRVQGRDVRIPQFHNGVAWARFHDLCGQPLGAADYLALADAARVLFLDSIPQLGRSNFNEAKRFVTLIDALYEARVRLICTAAALPEMLYIEGEGSFEFERTASRLREMQSEGWGA